MWTLTSSPHGPRGRGPLPSGCPLRGPGAWTDLLSFQKLELRRERGSKQQSKRSPDDLRRQCAHWLEGSRDSLCQKPCSPSKRKRDPDPFSPDTAADDFQNHGLVAQCACGCTYLLCGTVNVKMLTNCSKFGLVTLSGALRASEKKPPRRPSGC